MANGAAIALPREFAPTNALPSTNAEAAPVQAGVEIAIGEVVAAAAAVLCRGIMTFHHHGMLDAATKEAGGTQIARVAELALAHERGDLDFDRVAREQGKAVLRQYFDADFYRHYSAEQGEAALDLYIDGLLEIVSKVVAFERSFAN